MSFIANTRHGLLRRVEHDNGHRVLLVCPGCGDLEPLSDEQFHGTVSVHPPACKGGYHETHDFAAAVESGGGWRQQ